jgi:hypothetical protein
LGQAIARSPHIRVRKAAIGKIFSTKKDPPGAERPGGLVFKFSPAN